VGGQQGTACGGPTVAPGAGRVRNVVGVPGVGPPALRRALAVGEEERVVDAGGNLAVDVVSDPEAGLLGRRARTAGSASVRGSGSASSIKGPRA